jgi:dGTPase
MIPREIAQARERRTLEPYALFSGDSRGRRHPEPDDTFRTCWQRDRDRVIHSTAFRRLEYKTQVFANHEGDYYRTRLTHSLEVAQIARSVAHALGLNEGFVECLSLAHDLGHPPFGHAGGEALHARMAEHGGFEHNVQGLRIVDRLEQRYPDFPGLNLTFEIREAILKHGPTGPDAKAPEFTPMRPPALETQLVDLADFAAYQHHDLDDGLRSGMLQLEPMAREVRLVGEALAAARKKHPTAEGRPLHRLVVGAVVKRSIVDLIQTSGARLQDAAPADSDAARALRDLIAFSPEIAAAQDELHEWLFAHFYRHGHVVRMMEKAKRLLSEMFDVYVESPELLPQNFQEWVEREGPHRAVCDYLAGMTDRFAEKDWRDLFFPSGR